MNLLTREQYLPYNSEDNAYGGYPTILQLGGIPPLYDQLKPSPRFFKDA